MKKSLYLGPLVLLLVAVACEGPAGPEGPEGNANVVADTVTLSNADWEEGSIDFRTEPEPGEAQSSVSRDARVAHLNVPEITGEIDDFGMVLVYFKTTAELGGEPEVWTELPYSILAFEDTFTYNLTSSYEVGEITLYYYYEPNTSDASTPDVAEAELPDYTFKYVVASGNAAASVSAEGISTANHDDVTQFLGQRFDAGEDFRVLKSN